MDPGVPALTKIRPVWYAGPSTILGEFWTMLHLPYTLMVLSFVAVGAALAPHISWTILAGTLLAYFLGLGIGAHFLDQISGMGSRYVVHWPDWALWTIGIAALASAVSLGLVATVGFGGPILLLLVAVQALCAVGYPLGRWFRGALHRDSVFAVSWGSLPFLTSYYAQAGQVSLGALAIAGTFAAVAVVEIRISRLSRRLRAEARNGGSDAGTPMPPGPPAFRAPDTALAALSIGTALLALGLLIDHVMAGL
jgi:hypothetical protein